MTDIVRHKQGATYGSPRSYTELTGVKRSRQINRMKLLWLICIIAYIVAVRSESEADVVKKVAAGATAGNAIATALSSNDFSQTIATVAKNVAPFLGGFGPVLSLLTLFLPKSESAELKLMKQKFAEMDAKFDRVFAQFGEVKNLIKQTSLQNQYGLYEQKIGGLSQLLELVLAADTSTIDGRIHNFVTSFESTFANSAYNLWRGMTETNMIITDNIPRTAMNYTKYDRKRVDHIMSGMVQLILQGVIVELAYKKAIGQDAVYEDDKQIWTDRMNQLLQHIVDEDQECLNGYYNQSEYDVIDLAAQHQGASHESFADTVYNFLNEKYYWRQWFVVVYDPIKGSDNHIIKSCDGHSNFRVHGFNVVTASLEPSYWAVNFDYIHSLFDELDMYTTNWREVVKRPAKDIYEDLPEAVQQGCTVRSVGVILTSSKPVYKAPSDMLEVFERSFYTLSAFG